MRRVWLRASLVIAMLGVAAASGYQILLTEQRLAGDRDAQRAFIADAWTLAVSLSDLHAAQQAYVAAGQDRDSRMAAVAGRFDMLATDLAALSSLSTSPRTIGALDDAASAVQALKRVDLRVRDHLAAERSLMASDLIFDDSLVLAHEAARHVGLARTAERAARDATVLAHRQFQGQALAAAAGTGVFVALLLLPVGRPRAAAGRRDEGGTPAEEPAALPAGRLLLGLQPDHPSAAKASTEQPAVVPSAHGAPGPDLRLAADLCTELGRSSSASELPALLARTAQVLNASGIIVWVPDGTGATLRPALVHGYPAAALARLGALACDGDNATAAAFRDVRMHVVPAGDSGEHGALAAPLAAPEGCGGVMSLELNDGWESSESVQSTTAIIAAQLATLVAPDPASQATELAQA